jgi:transcriptional regulator with XRE-family HTH domain
VEITSTIVRVKGVGLVREPTKSDAGERLLALPQWIVSVLRKRHAAGVRLDHPVFPDSLGGFRDPANVRRDLREARSPVGSETRQLLGATLRDARRSARLTQKAAAAELGWSKHKMSLLENGRVRLTHDDAEAMLNLYAVPDGRRFEVIALVDAAGEVSAADALDWITSHNFRKTTATILDSAGLSASVVADQLGHARPSMTQDVYMGRGTVNPQAAVALDVELLGLEGQKGGYRVVRGRVGRPPCGLTCRFVRREGIEPGTR